LYVKAAYTSTLRPHTLYRGGVTFENTDALGVSKRTNVNARKDPTGRREEAGYMREAGERGGRRRG
jgi:hypothetical protein